MRGAAWKRLFETMAEARKEAAARSRSSIPNEPKQPQEST
jgi:hypothetical protein